MAKKKILTQKILKPAGLIDQMTTRVEEVKSRASIVDVFRHYGVNLKKLGNEEYTGLCCFHADKNSSLNVNEVKQVFKCFGCGKSGNIFHLIQEKEGLDFMEALRWLERFIDKTTTYEQAILKEKKQDSEDKNPLLLDDNLTADDINFHINNEDKNDKDKKNNNSKPLNKSTDVDLHDSSNSTKINETQKDSVVKQPQTQTALFSLNRNLRNNSDNQKPKETENNPGESTSLTLNEISEYYIKTFKSCCEEAFKFLEKKGLNNSSIISLFKTGFSDGTLIKKISKKQIKQLQEIGILKDNVEIFLNYITFAFPDETNRIISIAGINIYNEETKIIGDDKLILLNQKALKVYDEIILTNDFIDALSLINEGLNNTVSILTSDSFNASLLTMFKNENVGQITVAYNKINETAVDIIKDILVDEGFKVKIISPLKSHKNWNQAITSGINKDEIKDLIEKAQTFKKKEEKADFKVVKEKGVYIFTIDDLCYHIAGAKDIFVNSLKVAVDTEIEGDFFSDTVDLCSHRSRISFSNILSERFAAEPKRIENDLLTILKYFRDEMNKRLMPNEDAIKELTESEKKLGLTFLKSPTIFEDIDNDMSALGYVGESVNKKLMYLCATSRLMYDTLNVLLMSRSSAGKSCLIETSAKLMPPESVVDGKTFSKQALQYMGDKLIDKFFVMGEAIHDPDVDYQLRELLSSHKLIRHTVFKDEKTGEMITREIVVIAKMSSALTTTDYKINAENASRYFLVNTDETDLQSRNIVEENKNIYSEQNYYVKEEIIPEIIKKHHCAQRMLKKYVVIMPAKMREAISFPVFNLRCRRDSKRFFNLIATVCFLRQYQKEIKYFKNGVSYIECDAFDYEVAYEIMTGGVLSATFSELTQSVKQLHSILREVVRELSQKNNLKFNEVTFTQKQIRTMKNVGQTWLKTNLKILVDYEYVEIVRGGQSRTKGFYRLKDDEDLESLDIKKVLRTPEEIKKAMEEEN